jgi:integrase
MPKADNRHRRQDFVHLTRIARTSKKITVHSFRHTPASLLFEARAPIKTVQAQLGHKDIQTTRNVYTHISESMKEKTTKLLHDYIRF